jgi:hypothetical protein
VTVYIGIDPGLGGAVAFVKGDVASVYDAPVSNGTKRDYLVGGMRDLFAMADADDCRAVIEQVHAMPRQGVSSTFRFGRGLGLWEGLLAGMDISYELVTPQRWRKGLGIPNGADKAASRVCAQRLFTTLAGQLARVKDDGRAEALLLAEWRRRQG